MTKTAIYPCLFSSTFNCCNYLLYKNTVRWGIIPATHRIYLDIHPNCPIQIGWNRVQGLVYNLWSILRFTRKYVNVSVESGSNSVFKSWSSMRVYFPLLKVGTNNNKWNIVLFETLESRNFFYCNCVKADDRMGKYKARKENKNTKICL